MVQSTTAGALVSESPPDNCRRASGEGMMRMSNPKTNNPIAVLNPTPSTTTVPKNKKTQKKCTFPDGCSNNAKSRGLCKRHGGGMRCRIHACPTSARPGGLCIAHGGGLCKVVDCTTGARSGGLCLMHQRVQEIRLRRGVSSLDHGLVLKQKPPPVSTVDTGNSNHLEIQIDPDVSNASTKEIKKKKKQVKKRTRQQDLQLTTSETLSPLPPGTSVPRLTSQNIRTKNDYLPALEFQSPYPRGYEDNNHCKDRHHPDDWLLSTTAEQPPSTSSPSFPMILGSDFSSLAGFSSHHSYFPDHPPQPSSKYTTSAYPAPQKYVQNPNLAAGHSPSPFSNFALYGPTLQPQSNHGNYPSSSSSSNHLSMLLGHPLARAGETSPAPGRSRRGDSFSEFTTHPADLSVSILPPTCPSMGNSQHWTGTAQRSRSASMVVSPTHFRQQPGSGSSSMPGFSQYDSIDFSIQDVHSDLEHPPALFHPPPLTTTSGLSSSSSAATQSSNREVTV